MRSGGSFRNGLAPDGGNGLLGGAQGPPNGEQTVCTHPFLLCQISLETYRCWNGEWEQVLNLIGIAIPSSRDCGIAFIASKVTVDTWHRRRRDLNPEGTRILQMNPDYCVVEALDLFLEKTWVPPQRVTKKPVRRLPTLEPERAITHRWGVHNNAPMPTLAGIPRVGSSKW